jgi:hypothetical protein
MVDGRGGEGLGIEGMVLVVAVTGVSVGVGFDCSVPVARTWSNILLVGGMVTGLGCAGGVAAVFGGLTSFFGTVVVFIGCTGADAGFFADTVAGEGGCVVVVGFGASFFATVLTCAGAFFSSTFCWTTGAGAFTLAFFATACFASVATFAATSATAFLLGRPRFFGGSVVVGAAILGGQLVAIT